MKISSLTTAALLGIGMLSLRAEEPSEHLMTAGTQISGYVSTTISWSSSSSFLSGPSLFPVAPCTGSTLGPTPLLFEQAVFMQANRLAPPIDFPPLPPSPLYSEASVAFVNEVAPRIHWAPGSSAVELAATVPEPATMTLFGLGAAAMLVRARQRKRS